MITTKGDYVFVDEQMQHVRINCGPDTVTMIIKNAEQWQTVVYFRRADPDLRALAEALLACCEEDAHECGA